MFPDPTLTRRREGGDDIPLLVWRLPAPAMAISSATLGGGVGECHWLINATVPMSYDRDDPATHLAEIAAGLGLTGRGVGLMTGVDVTDVIETGDDGIRLWATVGLGAPIQAYDPAARSAATHAGTINVVAWVPQRLSDGALVNAVATITEAKTQAIRDLGLAATGTATDAICVLCPPSGPEVPYGGPRSRWGEPLASASYQAVLKGGEINLTGTKSWSERHGHCGRSRERPAQRLIAEAVHRAGVQGITP
ncbi:adenosylcobinamide amidohydrolase [Paractinoplanes durhamensis]|uniref:Adenosylcobinamide amidohydrolase n=1 Tax=Paractinoplanes durhamensis TaxID=113563 RepID=A0ABQ3YXA7_9ACTN|nr:adenosylcobinamide amidohydrolase [Actinoplanes durhamensis]GIE02216.1 adenosylcobinamide amidohydrolase [Actinoplanes durhamensis]